MIGSFQYRYYFLYDLYYAKKVYMGINILNSFSHTRKLILKLEHIHVAIHVFCLILVNIL